MPSRRGVARESARAIVGIAGIGVAALAIAGATWLPLPSFTVTPPSSNVAPVPTAQERTCPGPLLTLASNSNAATGAAAFAPPTAVYGTNTGADVQTRPLTPVDDTQGESNGSPVTLTVPAPAGSAKPPLVGAAQSQQASLEDFAGLAAASCDEAQADSWLVAGATTLGQTSLVLLSNPSTVPATVDLSVYSESGAVTAPGATGIVVAPGTQRIVPLAGLAPSAAAPIVHVVAQGGRVVASIEQSDIVGIDPHGVELVGPTAAPSPHLVIPGVVIRSLAALQSAQGGEGYSSDLPAVRVFVPGTSPATVRVGALGEKGTSMGNSYSATVKPGIATEIPLDHLSDGTYAVTIDSTQPLVAAARTSTVSGKAQDFGWFVATEPVDDTVLAAVPPGPGAVLHFANSGEDGPSATVKVTVTGTTKTLVVPSGGSAGITILAPGTYSVTGAKGLYVSTSLTGKGLVTSFPVNPPGPLASTIEVYPK
ncbi:DUF5719 family protein [Diaminobutyricibacter sp. McL0618]|uniref:DUF5719 family protein n=1 Tax=Leifsonia sp. McL0618 TaxID=3415677 RepID=UPI003CED9489